MRVVVAAVVVALALAATLAVARRPKWDELEGYTFAHFVSDFAKPYKFGSKAWKVHEEAFNARLESVRAHNARTDVTYRQGVNHLSDMTSEERQRMMPKTPILIDNPTARPHVPSAPRRGSHIQTVNGKTTVDWRKAVPAVLTAVKDQGQCGSCWAHAATEAIETATALATGNLYVLSQQEIASCTPNPDQCGGTGGCNGAIAELAIDYIKTVGIQEEWTWPYQSYWGKNYNCSVAATTFPVTNVSGYTHVGHNDADAVLDALAHAGPLAISVDASQWSNYESGIFSGCSYAKNISMDHAVQAVGYGYDETANQAYWLVRNSWSAGWGEHGFIRLARSATHACGWNVDPQNGDGCKGQTAPEWACGECGIGYDALYANYAPLA